MIKRELYGYLKEMTNGSLRIEKIVLNSGFTGVALDSGDMGIAMNVRTGSSVSGKISDFLQGKINVEALSVAADILKYIDSSGGFPEGSPAEKHLVHSVLVALYNALSKPFMKNEYLGTIGGRVEYNASKTSKSPSGEVKPGEIVTIVGFGGMVRSISQTAKETYVTELEPDLFSATLFSARGAVQGPDCCTIIPSSAAEECFKKADTVYITGCTLVTDTMDEILTLCGGKNIVVYGATAGFWPQPLLERGVKTIKTTTIKDSNLMVELLLNCAGAVERFFPMASENIVIEAL